MGKMVWAALEHHDRAALRAAIFYSLSRGGRRVDGNASVAVPTTSARVALRPSARPRLRIAADDLDILVDLSTHTKGARPGILALKPARVQLTHVASAGTVGLVDDRLQADRRFADVPENQRLPDSSRCCRWTAACIRIDTSRRRPAHPFRRADARDRVRNRASSVRSSSPLKLSRRCLRAVARRAGAHPAEPPRVVAGRPGAARDLSSA